MPLSPNDWQRTGLPEDFWHFDTDKRTGYKVMNCNLIPAGGWKSCEHSCLYCYANSIARRFPKNFERQYSANMAIQEIERRKPKWRRPRVILLMSMGDAFANSMWRESLKVIRFCMNKGVPVFVLTKSAPPRPVEDLFSGEAGEGYFLQFGVTVTTLFEEGASIVEPGAPAPEYRLEWLKQINELRENGYFKYPVTTFWMCEPLHVYSSNPVVMAERAKSLGCKNIVFGGLTGNSKVIKRLSLDTTQLKDASRRLWLYDISFVLFKSNMLIRGM